MTTTEKSIPVSKSAPQRAAPAKAAAKTTPKTPAAKVASKPTIAATTLSKAKSGPADAKAIKEKKPKLVRDSLTMPKAEYAVLDELKLRATKLSTPIKKTELIRAGIKALAAMSDTAFLAAVKAVPSLKTGRPSK